MACPDSSRQEGCRPVPDEGRPRDARWFVERVRDHDRIARRIQELAPWDARHELAEGVLTPCDDDVHRALAARVLRVSSVLRNLLGPEGLSLSRFLVCEVGSGALAFELLRRGARNIRAMDQDPRRIEQCRFVDDTRAHRTETAESTSAGAPSGLSWQKGDGLSCPFERPFDVVVALDSLRDPALRKSRASALFERTERFAVLEIALPIPAKGDRAALIAALRESGFWTVLESLFPAPLLASKERSTLWIACRGDRPGPVPRALQGSSMDDEPSSFSPHRPPGPREPGCAAAEGEREH